MKKHFVLFSAFFLLSFHAHAAPCTLIVTLADADVARNNGRVDGRAASRKIEPGGTICVMAGNYKGLTFLGFKGAQGAPITIRNEGGPVVIGNNLDASGKPDIAVGGGLSLQLSNFIKLSGSGTPGVNYGFRIFNYKTGLHGVALENFTSDVEIDHVEVAFAGFAGIMAKTDPSCDPATWVDNFVMNNIDIHHNYIHDVGGEGLYIGNSFWGTGMTRTCDGVKKQVHPHRIMGLKLNNNHIKNTGAEGLQFGCAPDASVHHNWLINTGISPFAVYQDNGLQIGAGSGGDVYANRIDNAHGSGIIAMHMLGGNNIYNNTITNAGAYGIFVNDLPGTTVPDSTIVIANNTILDVKGHAFGMYNELNKNYVYNNLVVMSDATKKKFLLTPGTTVADEGNVFAKSVADADLGNIGAFYILPNASSPLIDAGVNVAPLGIIKDARGQSRRLGTATDVGALEVR